MFRVFVMTLLVTTFATSCSLRDIDPPPGDVPFDVQSDICCTAAQCDALGRVCNAATCSCETEACCTDASCGEQGLVCNASRCLCEPPPCCTAAVCAQQGLACNPTSCACETTDCCTDAQCQALGKVCNTTSCACEPPACCSDALCAVDGKVCNTSTCACEATSCCTAGICAAQGGKVCNVSSCQCEAPLCCTQAECEAKGESCNTTTCACEPCCDDFQCTAQGKVCNHSTCSCEAICCTDTQCALTSKVCNTSTCRCEQPPCCTDAICSAQGKVCNTSSCQCEAQICCTDTECASSGKICNETRCECVDSAPQPCSRVGDPCDPAATQSPSYVCHDEDGAGVCRAFCSLFLDSPNDLCPQGTFCDYAPGQPGPEVYGFCHPSECTSFFVNDCPTGEKCIPNRNSTRICKRLGTGTEGIACNGLGACAAELLCVGGTCQRPDCGALSGTPACPSGDVCGGLVLGSQLIDVGFCYTACTAFASPSGCATGSWCYPIQRDGNRMAGECVTTGTLSAGQACSGSQCGAGLGCINGYCDTLCDTTATSGAGACPTGQGCWGIQGQSVTLDYGTCWEACGFHESTACTNSSMQCFPGELFGASFDLCLGADEVWWPLAERASCSAMGLSEYQLCSQNGVCLLIPAISSDLLCYDTCMTSQGAFGVSPHPDCRNSGRTCTNHFSASTFGLCQ